MPPKLWKLGFYLDELLDRAALAMLDFEKSTILIAVFDDFGDKYLDCLLD